MKGPPKKGAQMSNRLQGVLFLFVFILFILSAQVVESGSKEVDVPAEMAQLDDLSGKFIKEAGIKGSASAMKAAGEVRLLIGQFREVYGEEKGLPLRKDFLKEGAVFQKINNTLRRLLKALGGKPKRIDNLTRDLRDALDPLLGGKDDPRIFSYRPGYHGIHPGKDNFDVTVKGRNLNFHDSRIQLGETTIMPIVNTNEELIFSIPTEIMNPHPFKVTYKELILTVYKQKRTWSTLGFKKNIPIEYSLIVYSMPKNLAKFSVKIKKMTTGIERQSGKGPRWSYRSRGRQDIRRVFSHAAGNGWKFVPGSAEFVVTQSGQNGKTDVSIMMSPDMITVEMLSDGKASQTDPFEGYLTYTEWRNIKSVEEEKIASRKYLNWKDKHVITLPENTVSYVVSIETFNGIKRSMNEGTQKDKYVMVQYNSPSRQLSITPQKAATILGR